MTPHQLALEKVALAEVHLEALRCLHYCHSIGARRGDVSGWRVTLAFYLACACAQSALSELSCEPTSHEDREADLRKTGILFRDDRNRYLKLFDWSKDARYEGRKFSDAELREALSLCVAVRDAIHRRHRGKPDLALAHLDPSPYMVLPPPPPPATAARAATVV